MRKWIGAQLFLFLGSWAIYLSYWAVLLTGRGVSAQDVGLSVTAGLVARSLAVAVLFPIANRYATLLTIVRILPWLSVLAAVLFVPHGSVALLVVASVALGMTYPVMQPALETMATLAAARGLLAYGPTRLLGTLGFVLCTFLAGAVQSVWGTEALLWLFIGACVVIAGLTLLPTGESAIGSQRAGSGRDWAALFRRRNVVVMLLVMTALQASHAAYYTFGAIRFADLGASPTTVSALLVLAPAGEMVVLWLAPRFEQRLTVRRMLIIALAGAIVRWLVLGLAGTLGVAALTQPLHGLSFAFAQVAFVRFLTEQVPPELTGAAQGMMTALAIGLGTATMTAIAGVLWDQSVLLVFAAMAACAAIGLPLLTDRVLGRSRGNA